MSTRRILTGRVLAGAAIAVALSVTAACGGSPSTGSADKGSLTISGQNFPEATLMADMYQQLLEDDGYQVTVKLVGTRDVYMAKGQFPDGVQIVPEYLGGIADYLNTKANGSKATPVSSPDVTKTLDAAQELAKAKGIDLLEPSKATDANAFFTTTKYATAHNLTDLSSLGKSRQTVTLAAAPDCEGRTEVGS